MGTWSHEPFGNDTACDWAYEVKESNDWSVVAATIKRVNDHGPDYLDADLASEAVAAAEVLAKALGKGSQQDAYTEAVDDWLASMTVSPAPELLADADKALARILGDESELKELWQDSGDDAEWVASVESLRAVLGGRATPA